MRRDIPPTLNEPDKSIIPQPFDEEKEKIDGENKNDGKQIKERLEDDLLLQGLLDPHVPSEDIVRNQSDLEKSAKDAAEAFRATGASTDGKDQGNENKTPPTTSAGVENDVGGFSLP